MINFKRLRCLLLAALVLSVSYIHLLTSSLSVNASSSIPNTDITYDLWYWNNNQWVSFTNSQDGFTPNTLVRVRLRFNLPTSQNLQQGYNINFTFLHQTSDITDVTLNVLDNNGNIHQGDDIFYSGITVTNNNALTRTNIQINNFVCYNAPWAVLTFAYRSTTQSIPSVPTNSYIYVSVQNFSITEESPTAAINNLAILINNSFADMISSLTQGTQDIVDAVDDGNDSIIDVIGGLGMDVLEGIADTMSTVENAVDDLQDGILGGLSSLGSSILGGLTSLGQFVVDGIYDLFVPDADDLQAWISDFQDELYEECPIIGDVIGIFTRLVEFVVTGTQIDSYYVPETTLEFGDASITLGGWDVPLLPDGLDDYIDYVRLFTSLLVGIGFLFMFYHKLLNIFGIESVGEVEHELDWYLHKADQYNLSSRHMDDFWGDEEI